MEKWMPIDGTNGVYVVSSLGRVRSLDRYVKHNYGGLKRTKGRILRQSAQPNGYLAVPMFINGKEKRCSVHRLVMRAFMGNSDLQVNHINGDKKDNRLQNLEYCTSSQNLKHAFKIGLASIDGEKHPASKLTNAQANEIYQRCSLGESTSKIAKEFGVGPATICNIKYGRSYQRVIRY